MLIVATDLRAQSDLRSQLSARSDLSAVTVNDAEAARNAVRKTAFGVVVLDLASLTPPIGIELIGALHRQSPLSALIAVIAEPSYELAVQAVRSGATDVMVSGSDLNGQLGPRAQALLLQAQHQCERQNLHTETARLNEELLYKLTDTARRVGELRALISQRTGSPLPPTAEEDQVRLLLVEDDDWLTKQLTPILPKGFGTTTVGTGGAALDHASERMYDLALVKDGLPDLPGRMVARNLAAQAPETLVLLFSPPQPRRSGRIERLEGGRTVTLMAEFTEPKQLADRVSEIHQAQLARRRERPRERAKEERDDPADGNGAEGPVEEERAGLVDLLARRPGPQQHDRGREQGEERERTRGQRIDDGAARVAGVVGAHQRTFLVAQDAGQRSAGGVGEEGVYLVGGGRAPEFEHAVGERGVEEGDAHGDAVAGDAAAGWPRRRRQYPLRFRLWNFQSPDDRRRTFEQRKDL